jgi:hypothetical protein
MVKVSKNKYEILSRVTRRLGLLAAIVSDLFGNFLVSHSTREPSSLFLFF